MAETNGTEQAQTAVAVQPQQTTLYHSAESERFATEQRMARLFVQSGLFSDVKGTTQEQAIAQAYVKIALGGSMGFSPAESMQGIDIIQGRPAISAQLRAARMQRAGFSWTIDHLNDHGCALTIFFQGKQLGKAAFSEEDAKRMRLLEKDNYKKNPSDMYFARAISRAQRRYAPGVLSGDILTIEEAIDMPEGSCDDNSTTPQITDMPRRKSETQHPAEQQTLVGN